MERAAVTCRESPGKAAPRHLLVGAVLVALAAAGCTGGGPREDHARRGRPDVLLVTIDTFRADHLHAAGYERATTPTLDSLAASGALFTQAISQAPETTPSHASLLTGAYPPAHAVRSNGVYELPPEVTTLAELLDGVG